MREGRVAALRSAAPLKGWLGGPDALALATDILSLLFRVREPNPHAHPAALASAARHAGARRIALASWTGTGALQGLWPLAERRRLPGIPALTLPVPRFDVMAQPLLLPGQETEALGGLFDALIAAGGPRRLLLDSLPADGPFAAALAAHEATGRVTVHRLRTFERAVWDCDAGTPMLSLSPRSAKRLRQKRTAIPDLALAVDRDPAAIGAAFDTFVALEAAGWKGRQRTALANQPDNRAHVRATMVGMAETGDALTARLMSGARCLAVGLLPLAGGTMFFWKTAYDESAARLSPGVLLDHLLTDHLAAQQRIRLMDTCTSADVDPASQIWAGRRRMETALIELDSQSWQGRGLIAGWRLRERARALRNTLRG
jgi:hypothetical protein